MKTITWMAAALLLGAQTAVATPLRLHDVAKIVATDDDLEATVSDGKQDHKERFARDEAGSKPRWVAKEEVEYVEEEGVVDSEGDAPTLRTNLRSSKQKEEAEAQVWKSVDHLRGNLSHALGVFDDFVAGTDNGRNLKEEEDEITQRILRDIDHHHEHRRLVEELFSGGEEDKEMHIALWPCNWENIKGASNLPDGNWTSSQKTKWGEVVGKMETMHSSIVSLVGKLKRIEERFVRVIPDDHDGMETDKQLFDGELFTAKRGLALICSKQEQGKSTWDDIFGRENPATYSVWKLLWDGEKTMQKLKKITGHIKRFCKSVGLKFGEKISVPIKTFADKAEESLKKQREKVQKKCVDAGKNMDKAEDLVDLCLEMRTKAITLMQVLSQLGNGMCTAGESLMELNSALYPPPQADQLDADIVNRFCKPDKLYTAFETAVDAAQVAMTTFGGVVDAVVLMEQQVTAFMKPFAPSTLYNNAKSVHDTVKGAVDKLFVVADPTIDVLGPIGSALSDIPLPPFGCVGAFVESAMKKIGVDLDAIAISIVEHIIGGPFALADIALDVMTDFLSIEKFFNPLNTHLGNLDINRGKFRAFKQSDKVSWLTLVEPFAGCRHVTWTTSFMTAGTASEMTSDFDCEYIDGVDSYGKPLKKTDRFPVVLSARYYWQDCTAELTGQLRFPCAGTTQETYFNHACNKNFDAIKSCSAPKSNVFTADPQMQGEPGRFQASYICLTKSEYDSMDLLSTSNVWKFTNEAVDECKRCRGVKFYLHSSKESQNTYTSGVPNLWSSSNYGATYGYHDFEKAYSDSSDIGWWYNEVTSARVGPGWCEIEIKSDGAWSTIWSKENQEVNWHVDERSNWDNDDITDVYIWDSCGPGTEQYFIQQNERGYDNRKDSTRLATCNMGRKVHIEPVDHWKTDPCYHVRGKEKLGTLDYYSNYGYRYDRSQTFDQKFLTYCAMNKDSDYRKLPIRAFNEISGASPKTKSEWEAGRTTGRSTWFSRRRDNAHDCWSKWKKCQEGGQEECDLTNCDVDGLTWACVAPPAAEEESVLYMWSKEKGKGIQESAKMYCPRGRGIVVRQAHVGKGFTLYDITKFVKADLGLTGTNAATKQISDSISYKRMVDDNGIVPVGARAHIEAARLIWSCACPVGHEADFVTPSTQRDYRGTVSVTVNGDTCQRWDSQYPHEHVNRPEDMTSGGLGAHNYCRNSGNSDGGPWCYTTNSKVRWDYCDVGVDFLQKSYRGSVSVTKTGQECANWSDKYDFIGNENHAHYLAVDPSLKHHNHCRNPDNGEEGAWCYTKSGSPSWEYCDVELPGGKPNCHKCRPGTYRQFMEQEECLPCAPGTFAPTEGATECQACPLNHYSELPGMAQCSVCPQGKIIQTTQSGSSSRGDCQKCGPHEVADTLAGKCVPCPHDTHLVDGRCLPCPAGSVRKKGSEEGCTACKPGHQPVLLPSGDPKNKQEGYRGTVSVTRTTKRPCKNWLDGSYNTPLTRPYDGLGDHNYCRNPRGNEPGAWCYVDGSPSSELCEIGNWEEPQGRCEICPAGTYLPLGSVKCLPAPVGFYTDQPGQQEPMQCPCETPWTAPLQGSKIGATSLSDCKETPTNCLNQPDGELNLIDPDGAASNTWLPVSVICQGGKAYLPLSGDAEIENFSEGGLRTGQDPAELPGDKDYPWPGWRTTYNAYEIDQKELLENNKVKINTGWNWKGWLGARKDQNPSWAAFAEKTERIVKDGEWANTPLTDDFERFIPPGQAHCCNWSGLGRSMMDLRGTPFKLKPETTEFNSYLSSPVEGSGHWYHHKDKALEIKAGGRCGSIEAKQALEIHYDDGFGIRMTTAVVADGKRASDLTDNLQLFDAMLISCDAATVPQAKDCYGSDKIYHSASHVCACAVHAGYVDSNVAGPQKVVFRMTPLEPQGYEGTTDNGITSHDLSGPYGNSIVFQKASWTIKAAESCNAANGAA